MASDNFELSVAEKAISRTLFVKIQKWRFLDESWSFFWRPMFPCRRVVRLNSKKSKTKVMFCLNLNTKEVGFQNSGDGGFEFKPSFDQYLQIMESVKTARKKKKFDRLKSEDDDGGGGNGDSVDSDVKDGVSARRLELDRDVRKDDVKVKSGEAKDEIFRRRYSRKEMVSDKRNERGFRRNEGSRVQRVNKDVRWSKSSESSVTVPQGESFRRRYLKKEHHRSSDTLRGIDRGSKVDELDLFVEEKRFQRIAKDVRWSINSGESSVTVSEDESFGRRYPKQEMARYQRFSDSSKGIERGSKGDGLDLLAEERRMERLANERHELRSSKLSITRRIGARRDDDDSLFAMETPAFKFSDESSDIVDSP